MAWIFISRPFFIYFRRKQNPIPLSFFRLEIPWIFSNYLLVFALVSFETHSENSECVSNETKPKPIANPMSKNIY